MEETLPVQWQSFSFFDYVEGTGTFFDLETVVVDKNDLSSKVLISTLVILLWATIRLSCHRTFCQLLRAALFYSLVAGRIIYSTDVEHEIDGGQDIIGQLTLQSTVALYGYHCTERMDYHTLNRNLFHIIMLGTVYSILSLLIVTPIGHVMMEPAFGWTFHETFVLSIALLSVEVEHTVYELRVARGQIRRLMQILMGERLVTLCIASTVQPAITSSFAHDLDDPDGLKHLFRFLIWGLIKTPIVAVTFFAVCMWLSDKAGNDHVAQVMLTLPTTFGIYTLSLALGTPQTLTVVMFGILMNASKPQVSGQKERFITYFWHFLNITADSFVYFHAGLMCGLSRIPDLNLMDLGFIWAFFALNFFARTLTYMILNPLFLKMGLQPLPWRQAALAIFGGYKGRPNIYLAMAPIYRGELFFRGFVYTVIITLLGWFGSIMLMTGILSILGFYDLDRTAIVNMNTATLHVNNCRTRALFALKTDRFISDANWGVVDRITHLSHPYKKQLKNKLTDTDFGEVFQTKTIACKDCGKETLAPLTRKQLEDLRLEAKHRILKAQLVSFVKQHESGTLSAYGFRVLANLAELASLKEDPAMDSTEVKIQRGNKFLHCIRSALLLAQKWTMYEYSFVPTNKIRFYCYCLSTSLLFQFIMAFLSIVDLVMTMCFVGEWSKNGEDSNAAALSWLQGISIFFYFLYVFEFFIHILGLGIPQYFKRHVNKIEFGTSVVMRTCEVSLYFVRCSKAKSLLAFTNLDYKDQMIITRIKMGLVGRLSRVYIFFSGIIPKALAGIELQMDEVLLRNYDTGKAYLIGLERVGKFMTRITENETTYEEMKKAVDQDRFKITKEMSVVQKDYPKIAVTVKTRHAVRHVINEMTDCVADMKEEGILDSNETKFLLGSIEELKTRHKLMARVEPCQPDYIFKEIPWLHSEYFVVNYLLKRAELNNFDYGDVIIQHGDDPVGLFVLVSGLVKSIYRPSPTTIQLSAKFGVLPNYDFFVNMKMDQPQEEYIVAGNAIGETGAVTGRRYDMTVVCETAAQAYFVPFDALKTILFEWEEGDGIQKNIWKTIGMRIGEILFQMDHTFNTWSREELYSYLQRGVVMDLRNVTAIFKNDLVDDIILIEGAVMNRETREIYFGPYHLPRETERFLLPEHELWDFQTVYETRLLIIPKPNINEDDLLSMDGGIFAEKRAKTTSKQAVSKEMERLEKKQSGVSSPHRTAHAHLRKRVGFMAEPESRMITLSTSSSRQSSTPGAP